MVSPPNNEGRVIFFLDIDKVPSKDYYDLINVEVQILPPIFGLRFAWLMGFPWLAVPVRMAGCPPSRGWRSCFPCGFSGAVLAEAFCLLSPYLLVGSAGDITKVTESNPGCTFIDKAKSKGKEIERKGFDEESFVHQEPPPRAPIKGGSGFPEEETTRRELHGGGGGVANHYGRYFRQGEWATGDGGGRAESWDRVMQERMDERWESRPRYTRGNMEGSR
ncbi:hypothetical protein IEQ34_000634 [Dendrobium chrysotoxum]|uniref:Uncharacterized protein n=1 Tax=Dendrobium chrysotoxum TaxID=161865 RepID=A0AAV7HP17_DENCH|nr:hypothetical protein IEQ34_000634 [Dendrobium chrysotoxum]